MDRLAAMEAFVRVIDAGSFSGAAKQLRVGQSTVSKTIAQLEDRLGVRLLLRSTHGLTLTEAGRNFYERARRTIEEAEQAEAAAVGESDQRAGDGVDFLYRVITVDRNLLNGSAEEAADAVGDKVRRVLARHDALA